MLSMLESIAQSEAKRPVWYIHGAEHGRVHAMREHVRTLASAAPNVTVRTFYRIPEPADVLGRDYDEEGVISGSWLIRNTPHEESTYYLCGPRPFPARCGWWPRSKRSRIFPHQI